MADLRMFTKKDNVFATLMSKGKILKAIMGSDFSNISDVVKHVCKDINETVGLVQLSVRNQSQGWSVNMLLNIRGNLQREFSGSQETCRDGLQYRLMF